MSTTAAPPFDPGRGYGKFAALAPLDHAGDFAVAARAMRGMRPPLVLHSLRRRG